MLAQPFSTEYSNTINSLGQQQHAPIPHPPIQPSHLPPADDLPAHPIVQHFLLNSSTSSSSLHPPTLSSPAGQPRLAPPSSSDFFTAPSQEKPYFLFCLSCSSPLSDVFHVTDGDDSTVTVDAVYTDAVLSATQPTVLPQQGLFYALSCQRCGGHVGRYYRFTSPGAINKCNMFSLDVQCVGVRTLGSGSVKGEQYAEETGIATRLTQLMLTTQAVREEMDEAKAEAARMRDELDRARARMRRAEQKLRRLMGDEYDDDEDEESAQAVVDASQSNAQKQPSNGTTSSSAPSPSPALTPSTTAVPRGSGSAARSHTSASQPGSSAKKRARQSGGPAASRASNGDVSGGKGGARQSEEKKEEDEFAFVPAVKRKEKAVAGDQAKGSVEAVVRDDTEDEQNVDGDGELRRPKSAANGAKRGRQRKVTRAPQR